MSIDRHYITVSNIPIEIVRKDIKNLHLGVYPPEGSVRLSVPQHITDDNARLAVVARLSWIKQRQAEFKNQPRQSQRQYLTGESHYFKGKRYILEIVERGGRQEIELKNSARIRMYVKPDATEQTKALILENWYRKDLKSEISLLLEKWLPIIDVSLSCWGIRRMKTKWGSCNISSKRIWLNSELAKKSPECLEYILVHELVHLHERHHNENFQRLMDKYMPHWRKNKARLKSEPLSYEDWDY